MDIHVNAGNGVDSTESMERWANEELRSSLERFASDVRRVEVHLSDVNSGKGGADDKRCAIQAHGAQLATAAVTHDAPSLNEALRGASGKLVRLLDSQIGKRRDVRDHSTIRKDPEILPVEE